jgi:hypothetical protein
VSQAWGGVGILGRMGGSGPGQAGIMAAALSVDRRWRRRICCRLAQQVNNILGQAQLVKWTKMIKDAGIQPE